MRRLLLAILALPGCHQLFGLTEVGTGADAAESSDSDGRLSGCSTVEYDEDDDSIDDRCDACPTVPGGTIDDDADGLPNQCDPSGSTQDKILYVATFATADLARLSWTNAAWSEADHGTLRIGLGALAGKLELLDAYQPTHIELRLSGANPDTLVSKFNVQHGSGIVECNVSAAPCSGTGLGTCVSLQGGGSATLGSELVDVTRLDLYQASPGVHCDLTAGGSTATATGDGSLGNYKLTITTTGALDIMIQSIVLYGAK